MTPVALLGISTIDQRPVGVGLFESLDAARDHFETARLPENCLWSAFTPEMGTVTLCRKHAHDGNLHMMVFTKEKGNDRPSLRLHYVLDARNSSGSQLARQCN